MDEFVKSETGRILLSIIWGLGIAALFRKICGDGADCIIIKGPNPNKIKQNYYNLSKGKCIRYEPYYTNCKTNAIEQI